MFSIAAIVWLVIAVAFLIAEALADAYILPLAIGAAGGFVAVLFDAPVLMQVVVFAVVAVLAFVLFRPNKQKKVRKGEAEPDDDDRDF